MGILSRKTVDTEIQPTRTIKAAERQKVVVNVALVISNINHVIQQLQSDLHNTVCVSTPPRILNTALLNQNIVLHPKIFTSLIPVQCLVLTAIVMMFILEHVWMDRAFHTVLWILITVSPVKHILPRGHYAKQFRMPIVACAAIVGMRILPSPHQGLFQLPLQLPLQLEIQLPLQLPLQSKLQLLPQFKAPTLIKALTMLVLTMMIRKMTMLVPMTILVPLMIAQVLSRLKAHYSQALS